MTHDRRIERLLDAWLAEGPQEVSDRVFDDLVDRVDRQPQRPAWRVAWRESQMFTPVRLIGLAAAIALAVAGVGVLTSQTPLFGGPNPTPQVTGAPPTAAPQATQRFKVTGPCGGADSTCRGFLQPGTYTSRAFRPELTYTVPEDWYNKWDAPSGYGLIPWDGPNAADLQSGGFGVRIVEVINDLVIAARDCSEQPEPGVGRTSRDIVEFLANEDGLTTTDPQPVTLAGLSGRVIDISLAEGWTGTCPPDDGPSVPTLTDVDPGPGVHWVVLPGEHQRFVVLDKPQGGTLLISLYSAPGQDWDAFEAVAMPIVESFSIEP